MRFDFKTHLIYASCLANMSKGAVLSFSNDTLATKNMLHKLKKKFSLITLTKKSLDDELKIVNIDKEYSTASVLWLPIKIYYLIYHLQCFVGYLITSNDDFLSKKHSDCIKEYTKMLANGTLTFSQPVFNLVFDKKILNYTTTPGDNVRSSTKDEVIFNLIMKYIAKHKILDFKEREGIKDIRFKKNKERVNKFKNNMSISIFDFFYVMRIKSNYKNSDFITDISSQKTKKYFEEYYRAGDYFYKSLKKLTDEIIYNIDK